MKKHIIFILLASILINCRQNPNVNSLLLKAKTLMPMKMKLFYIFLLLVSSFSLFGQRENELQINAQHLTSLKLSDFADKSDAIQLSKKPETNQFIWVSAPYLYLAGINKIYQYHFPGKYIRAFDCGGFVLGIAGDEVKRELYIPVSKDGKISLNCYDYSGILLREFSLKHNVCTCINFENRIWMIQSFQQNDTVYYKLSNVDNMNGEVNDLGVFHKDYYWPGFSVTSAAVFSMVNGRLFFSVNTDSTLYQVRGNRFEPYLRWRIEPEKRFLSDRDVVGGHMLMGPYLFVNYGRNDPDDPNGVSCKKYLYIKTIKGTPEEYNVRYEGNVDGWSDGLVDDLYHTGYVSLSKLINKPDYLYFTSMRVDEQTKKSEYWIYLVRVKK